jgi:diketogulonate reductase-like aldo/keto reductase
MLSTDPPQVVADLCKKYGKTPSQIAINWLISQKDVVTLSKMGHKEHLMENLGALGWEMEAEDIEKLRTEFPDQQNISDSVPLKE